MGVNLSQVACKGRQSVDRLIYLRELFTNLECWVFIQYRLSEFRHHISRAI